MVDSQERPVHYGVGLVKLFIMLGLVDVLTYWLRVSLLTRWEVLVWTALSWLSMRAVRTESVKSYVVDQMLDNYPKMMLDCPKEYRLDIIKLRHQHIQLSIYLTWILGTLILFIVREFTR